MTRRRRLLGLAGMSLAGMALPGPALAATPQPPGSKPPGSKPSGSKPPDPKPSGKAAETATGKKPARQPAPNVPAKPAKRPAKSTAARATPAPVGTTESAIEAAPQPIRPAVRAGGDGPSLRPLDRELVRGWMAANPDWQPPGPAPPVAAGKPLPAGVSRQPLPPGLAVLLPYFPGYRYAAAGPDLVLYAAGTEQVASLLPGALAR